MRWEYHDGGRAAAGYKGRTNDCVARAAAITTGLPYREVYAAINEAARSERRKKGRSSARTGVHKRTMRRLMETLGWQWVPCMRIGSGCETRTMLQPPDQGVSVPSIPPRAYHFCGTEKP